MCRSQDCPIGTYCDSEGQASAPQCPFPTTTSGAGSTFCDACVPGFYWDTVYWEEHKDTDCADEPCVDACVDCDEIDPDGGKHACCLLSLSVPSPYSLTLAVDCDVPGIRLESIPVHEGWWRATKLSTEVYECRWKDACKGGNDTSTSAQCARAYTGALCGACKNEYDYDSFQGKCVKCKPAIRIVGSPGTITFIVLFALAIILIVRHYGLGKLCAGLKQTFLDVLTDKVDPRRVGKKGVELASKRKKSDGSGSKGDELESSDEDDESPQEYRGQQSLGQLPQPASSKSVGQIEQEKRERFWTSVMTKVKICESNSRVFV